MPFITATSRPTSTWSVFGQSVRTNNYVEGWHCRLNGKASHRQLNLYLLLTLLGGEAALVDVNVNLVKEFQRQQRRSTRSASARLFHVWDTHVARQRQTLHAASHVIPTLWFTFCAYIWTVTICGRTVVEVFSDNWYSYMWSYNCVVLLDTFLFMVALWNRADHYIFILWFLLSIFYLFFPRLISAVAEWMSTILLHMVWP